MPTNFEGIGISSWWSRLTIVFERSSLGKSYQFLTTKGQYSITREAVMLISMLLKNDLISHLSFRTDLLSNDPGSIGNAPWHRSFGY